VPSIRAEFAAAGVPFEQRVGRMLEGLRLCRALWSGKPVDWDGRWPVKGSVLGPVPHRTSGPPIWLAGSLPASLDRIAREFDGWMPNDGDAFDWSQRWADLKARTKTAGRDPSALTGSVYLTVAVDDDADKANTRLDTYLEQYYDAPAAVLRRRQVCYAGPAAGLTEWLQGYVSAGAQHLIVRCAGDHERHLGILAAIRVKLTSSP
jgi:alkanesulfonate monooxygenase SsuD/methylene tetrahydromethanopterin reductase-like flavin-dependent oxidoreductase (luciferase family)